MNCNSHTLFAKQTMQWKQLRWWKLLWTKFWTPSPRGEGVQQQQGWRELCRQASSSQGGPVAATWASDQQPVKMIELKNMHFPPVFKLQWLWFNLRCVDYLTNQLRGVKGGLDTFRPVQRIGNSDNMDSVTNTSLQCAKLSSCHCEDH